MIAIVDERRWIMALRSGVSHISWGQRDAIHLITSTDEGRTWSELDRWFDGSPIRGMPFEDGHTHSEPGLYVTPNGDLILQFWRTGYTSGTRQLRSSDDGRTWRMDADRLCVQGVDGADGDLALGTEDWFVDPDHPADLYLAFQYFHYRSTSGTLLARSRDDGRSFRFVGWIVPPGPELDPAGRATFEPAVEYVGDRTIVAVLRDAAKRGRGEPGVTWQTVSTDMGASFAPPVDITGRIDGGVAGGMWQRARLYLESNPRFQHGNRLDFSAGEGTLWGFGLHSIGGGYTRKPVVYRSHDRGRSWHGPELLHGPMHPGDGYRLRRPQAAGRWYVRGRHLLCESELHRRGRRAVHVRRRARTGDGGSRPRRRRRATVGFRLARAPRRREPGDGVRAAGRAVAAAAGPARDRDLRLAGDRPRYDDPRIAMARELTGIDRNLTTYGDPTFSRFIRRAFLASQGFDGTDLERPVVGIADTSSDYNTCHAHMPALVDAVKRGVLQAGGLPLVFPTISLNEILFSPTTMFYRNLLAMETEEMIRAQPMDAVVLLGGCDKTVPAQLMAAVSANVPAVVCVTGAMRTGAWRGERVGACTDCRRYYAGFREGRIGEEELREVQQQLCSTPGTCMVMGSASTIACVAETVGLMLPGGASPTSGSADRLRNAVASGRRAALLAREPGDARTDPDQGGVRERAHGPDRPGRLDQHDHPPDGHRAARRRRAVDGRPAGRVRAGAVAGGLQAVRHPLHGGLPRSRRGSPPC